MSDKSAKRIKEIIEKLEKPNKVVIEANINFTQQDIDALQNMTPDERIRVMTQIGKGNIAANKASSTYNNHFSSVTKPKYSTDGGAGRLFTGDAIENLCKHFMNNQSVIDFFRGFFPSFISYKKPPRNLNGDFIDIKRLGTTYTMELVQLTSSIFKTKGDEIEVTFTETNGECMVDIMTLKIFNKYRWNHTDVRSFVSGLQQISLCTNGTDYIIVDKNDDIEIKFK